MLKSYCDVRIFRLSVTSGYLGIFFFCKRKRPFPYSDDALLRDLKYRKFHKGFKNHLRSHLKIYPKYVQMAQETFRKVAKSMKISPEKLTYVGMHHRQTGILIRKFQRKKHNSQFFLISYNYFLLQILLILLN